MLFNHQFHPGKIWQLALERWNPFPSFFLSVLSQLQSTNVPRADYGTPIHHRYPHHCSDGRLNRWGSTHDHFPFFRRFSHYPQTHPEHVQSGHGQSNRDWTTIHCTWQNDPLKMADRCTWFWNSRTGLCSPVYCQPEHREHHRTQKCTHITPSYHWQASCSTSYRHWWLGGLYIPYTKWWSYDCSIAPNRRSSFLLEQNILANQIHFQHLLTASRPLRINNKPHTSFIRSFVIIHSFALFHNYPSPPTHPHSLKILTSVKNCPCVLIIVLRTKLVFMLLPWLHSYIE